MAKKTRTQVRPAFSVEIPNSFTSQAGLLVNTCDEDWVLAPFGKGSKVNVGWLLSSDSSEWFRNSLLDVLIHYAESCSSATTATQCYALKIAFPEASESLDTFNNRWFGFGDALKKTLKGFFSTALNLNHKQLYEFAEVTKAYTHKIVFNALHPTKGRLSDYEYDSVLENLRILCDKIPLVPPEELSFYQIESSINLNKFNRFKGLMAYRTMIQIARRPQQLTFLKWSDLRPIGNSFNNEDISSEPLNTGIKAFHLRSFKIKQTGKENSFRSIPERFTIPLSESFSELLIRYNNLYVKGLKLAIASSNIKISSETFSNILRNCPLFPTIELFKTDFSKSRILETLQEKNHSLFHPTASSLKAFEKSYGIGTSELHGTIIANNNRLRHTWLCNAALDDLSIMDIGKITNVTQNAARMYLQLGLKERQFIDRNYAANEFLRAAFNPKPFLSDNDNVIESETIGPVGVEKDKPNCHSCVHKTRMVRPIPCYGCNNFIPLLEANHQAILEQASAKRDFMNKFGGSSKNNGAVHRLDKAIQYIKLTISICNEEILRRRSLKNKSAIETEDI